MELLVVPRVSESGPVMVETLVVHRSAGA